MSQFMDALNEKAADDGIESFELIRAAVIEARNTRLSTNDFETAVLLTHVTWWLSVLQEEVES